MTEDKVEVSNAWYSMARAAWMMQGAECVKMMLNSPELCNVIKDWVDAYGHPLLKMHLEFVAESLRIKRSEGEEEKELREVHKAKHKNFMLYCTTNKIDHSQYDQTDWRKISEEIDRSVQVSSEFLYEHLLPRLLGSSVGRELAIRAHRLGLIVKEAKFPHMLLEAAQPLVESMLTAVCVYHEESKELFGSVPSALGGEDMLRENLTNEAVLLTSRIHQNVLLSQVPISLDQGYYRLLLLVDMASPKVAESLARVQLFLELVPSTTSCNSATDVSRGLALSALPDNYDDNAASFTSLALPLDPILSSDDAHQPVTARGERNLDMYGKTIGKKHQDINDHSTESPLWFTQMRDTLGIVLKHDEAREVFTAFLENEGRRAPLDFYLQVSQSISLTSSSDNAQCMQKAKEITLEYNRKLAQAKIARQRAEPNEILSVPCKVSQNDLTAETRTVWQGFYDASCGHVNTTSSGDTSDDKYDWIQEARVQAQQVFAMLAVDSFTRFVLSKEGSRRLVEIAESTGETLKEALAQSPLLPSNVQEWMQALISIIEHWPACMVVADMTIAGAPMIHVNPMFLDTTQYKYSEAVGRNCRFLQGPATEAEGIDIIRRTLKDGRDCHVILTNYRKDGTLFKNLLTMRPIFDGGGVYRYCIGVQFEIKDPKTLQLELGRLDKLLQLLPCLVPFQGTLHESYHLPQSCLHGTVTPPSPIARTEKTQLEDLQENQRFAITKIAWLASPRKTLQTMLNDPLGIVALEKYLTRQSPLGRVALDFCLAANKLLQLREHALASRASDLKRIILTCTELKALPETETKTAWIPVLNQLKKWQHIWLDTIQKASMRSFCMNREAVQLFEALRCREKETNNHAHSFYTSMLNPTQSQLRTLVSSSSAPETFFLDALHEVSLSLGSDLGLVVSDMRTPGLPLIYISAGFLGVTGYGREQIGSPCSFLQGPNTEPYLVEEIVDALRDAQPCYLKLTNYKESSQPFQCCVSLCPIFAATQEEYIFQVGLQIDFTRPDSQRHISTLGKLADFLRFLPKILAATPNPSPAGIHNEDA